MPGQYSEAKIFYHRDALDALRRGDHIAPIYVRMKPTNICNHHCEYCAYGSGGTRKRSTIRNSVCTSDQIPWDKMREIVDDFRMMGVKAVTFSGGGEPLTYPHIIETMDAMKESKVETSLITNGQLLSGDIAQSFYDAKWVRVSFDSPNEAEYAKLRGVSEKAFHQVVNNIREFAKKKSHNCVLGIHFVISKANARRVYEGARFLKNLGVDNIKFSPVIDNAPHYHDEIKDEVIEQIYHAKETLESDTFQIINSYESDWKDKNFSAQSFSTCYTCRLVTVIAADQKVYLCHPRAYDSKAALGDLRGKRFKDMWFSDSTKEVLSRLKPMRDCKNYCVFEKRNQLLQSYFEADINHINFI